MRASRTTKILCGVGILLAILFYLRPSNSKSVVPSGASVIPPPTGSQAEVQLGPFSFSQTDDGVPSVEITARQGRVFEKTQRADIKGVAATIRSQRGWMLKLVGDTGIFDMTTQDFSLTSSEPVRIQSNDGYTMRVAALTWLNDSGTIVATGPVLLHSPQVEIQGQALEVVVDAQEVTVSGDVEARIN